MPHLLKKCSHICLKVHLSLECRLLAIFSHKRVATITNDVEFLRCGQNIF